MKSIKTILAVCLMVMASAVYAQADAWKGVRVGYNSFDCGADGADAVMALTAGYVHSFAITENLPLFVEVGGELLWVNGDVYDDVKLKMWSLQVPVSIGYKWAINDDWSIYPNVGVYLRGNLSGKIGDLDIFDEEEVGEEWERFNYGLHVGTTANYKNFNLGVKYGLDLNEIAEDCKSKMWTITLGYNF